MLENLKLGDKIATATKMVGISPCADCKDRQAWLNALTETRKETKFPFGNPFETKGSFGDDTPQ